MNEPLTKPIVKPTTKPLLGKLSSDEPVEPIEFDGMINSDDGFTIKSSEDFFIGVKL